MRSKAAYSMIRAGLSPAGAGQPGAKAQSCRRTALKRRARAFDGNCEGHFGRSNHSDANMRRSIEIDHGENHEPGVYAAFNQAT